MSDRPAIPKPLADLLKEFVLLERQERIEFLIEYADEFENVPERIATAVMRAISRRPADRFSSSAAFAEAFRAALDARPSSAPAEPEVAKTEVVTLDPVPTQRSGARAPLRAPLSVAAVLVAGALVVWAFDQSESMKPDQISS